jgi:predicted SAM-dependent methyltransferase
MFGTILRKKRNVSFPKNVLYGNILRGFPQYKESCDAVYCSHVLEHLTYKEFFIAIDNTYSLLKKGGIFRLVMPNLKIICETYIYGGGGC